MKTAEEMIQIIKNEIKGKYATLKRYEKKYQESGRESWYTLITLVNEKIILLEYLYKEFTGMEYTYEE